MINILILFSAIGFIFHQLITANQTFIFSLAPILCGLFIIQLDEFLDLRVKNNIKLFSILLILFVTLKYHFVFNEKRKFMDLQNINLSKAVDANLLDERFKKLKWITPSYYSKSPKEEIELLRQSIKIIKNDLNEKMLITHYQFVSTILNEDLNILNRWYLWDNNTHPTENHKYFEFYKNMINKNLTKNKIQVIYLLGQDNEILFKNIKNYFTNVCFKSKTLEAKRFSVHELIDCKK